MRLWLLRHARVQLPPGLCYGASDVPADPAHTQATAQHWATRLPAVPEWRVSALGRAQQLAQALRDIRPDLPMPVVDARLNEMHFGDWELQPWQAIPREAFDPWMDDFAHHRFGGVESTQMLLDRVAQALHGVRSSGHNKAVWVTHAGVIRAVTYLLQGGHQPIAQAADWPRSAPLPGAGVCVNL